MRVSRLDQTPTMETNGETSELEIDSELVMSFYDQYQQTDDLPGCKVYCGVEGIKTETGHQTVNTSIIELKPGSGADQVDSSPGHVSSSHVSTSNTWNLPDLLVGLDGITTRSSSDSDSPPLPPPSSHNNIPCISLPTLPNLDNTLGQHGSASQSYYFEPSRLPSLSVSGHNTDSLLEGLGILSPVAHIKTEMVTCPSPVSHGQYSLVDSRVDMVDSRVSNVDMADSPITMDLSQLVSQHNIPANFELSLSPVTAKLEPGAVVQGGNIASVSITPHPPLTTGHVTPLPLDLIAQHCTLLPPELVSIQPPLPPVSAISPTSYTISHHQDLANNNIQADMEPIINPVNIKEEEECMSPKLTGEPNPLSAAAPLPPLDNPSYKRCHLCVRIFSTKANLSSHIRHVHLGEAKHSRVKSIPCPHCNKMFSRKGHMTEHVRTVHEGKKRIYKEVNCQHCGKTFRRKWGLNIHISSAHADVISSLVKQ